MTTAAASIDAQDLDARALRMVPAVRRIARGMLRRLPARVDLDELVGAGGVGLAQAVKTCREGDPAGFEAYAVQRIQGAILDEVRRWDSLTRVQRDTAGRIAAAASRLTAALGRRPEPAEVASAAGVSLAEYHESRRLVQARHSCSLEAAPGSAAPRRTPEPAADDVERIEDVIDRHRQILRVRQAMARLPARLRRVLELHYFGGRTLRAIGRELGVSEARVCQLRNEAAKLVRAECARSQARRAPAPPRPARPRGRGTRASMPAARRARRGAARG